MEVAFYAMQTVRIRNQDVLMFYDSGSNSHLIEGTLAEQLRLDVLASECVPVGALGGKTSWSEFGAYTVTLGPDMNGEVSATSWRCKESLRSPASSLRLISRSCGKMPSVCFREGPRCLSR